MLRSVLALALLSTFFSTGAAHAATSSIKCSNGTVTVSTGGSTGTCVKSGTVITCGQDQPNQAGGGCDASGNASCGNTSGAGSCTIAKKLQVGTTPPMPKGSMVPGVEGAVKGQKAQ